ncbi:hypothetical protein GO497_15240 [Acidovorax citrulli]|nr:hypothetical protein [Paracidovorax citrulli]
MPDAANASGPGMLTDGLRKQWDYDAAGELVRTRHSRNGETQYRYDPAGHVLSATLQAAGAAGGLSPALQQALHEVFHYDPAGNRLDAPVPQGAEGSRGWVRHNRVKVLQDKRFDYDGFGRLVRKRIGGHTELHCRYDALHRMIAASVIRAGRDGEPIRQVFRYRYDPLGRRIAKEDDFGETRFVWGGHAASAGEPRRAQQHLPVRAVQLPAAGAYRRYRSAGAGASSCSAGARRGRPARRPGRGQGPFDSGHQW